MTTAGRRVWPWQLAAAEGVATARTSRWTALLLMVTVAWIVAAPGAADAISVSRMVTGERVWLDAGGHIYRFVRPDVDGYQVGAGGYQIGVNATGSELTVVGGPGPKAGSKPRPISAVACKRLARLEGVSAAFTIQRASFGSLTQAPGQSVALILATPGVLKLFGVAADPGGTVLVSANFAERVGIRDGDHVSLVLHREEATNGGIADGGMFYIGPPGQRVGTSSDVLTARVVRDSTAGAISYPWTLIVPTVDLAEPQSCIVQTNSTHASAVIPMVALELADEGASAALDDFRMFGEFTVDYSTAYETRALRFVWVACAVLLGLLWALLQWFRRSHAAIYATFGMRAASRVILQTSEWGVLAGLGLLWGWSLGVVGALAFGARAEQALTQVTYHAALTMLGATVIVVLLGLRPTGTLLHALKDN